MKEYINNLLFFGLGVILTLGILKKYLDHDTIIILASVGVTWVFKIWYDDKEKTNIPKAIIPVERTQSQRFVHQKTAIINIKQTPVIAESNNVVDLNSYRKQKKSSFNRVIS